MAAQSEALSQSFLNASEWVLITNEPKNIKKIKVFLEDKGLYDKTRLITKLEEKEKNDHHHHYSNQYAIPVTYNYCHQIEGHLLKEKENGDQNLASVFEKCQLLETNKVSVYTKLNTRHITVIDTLVFIVRSIIEKLEVTINLKDTQLEEFIQHLYTLKYYRHGDLVVLSNNNNNNKENYKQVWTILQREVPSLWTQIAQGFQCNRIGLQNGVLPDGYRTPNMVMVLGDNGWVEHIDNGVTYIFDVTKCMFSQGNISEKIRMSLLDCSGETIVDLYAGIGYFTLPLLVHSNPTCIHACEWNPIAVEGLKKGLVANKIKEGKCIIHIGDNRKVAPVGIGADRIILGLIPSSQEGWPIACMCLNKEKGGWIHVHENVSDKEIDLSSFSTNGDLNDSYEEENMLSNFDKTFSTKHEVWSRWAQNVVTSKFKSLLENSHQVTPYSDNSSNTSLSFINKEWSIIVRHIEHVKSYAPHIDHIVVDLECRPMNMI